MCGDLLPAVPYLTTRWTPNTIKLIILTEPLLLICGDTTAARHTEEMSFMSTK